MTAVSDLEGLSDHAARNRADWNARAHRYQAEHGQQIAQGAAWGVWQIPEEELNVLGDVTDKDVLEYGCGAAQWSIALARRGARPVGLDLSEGQLTHARRLMAEANVDFPLVHASAEDVPLQDGSFDIVFCDHGAMSFCDPYVTVPEAARLLRPGGLFAFSHVSPLLELCWPVDAAAPTDRLDRDYFSLFRTEEEGRGEVTFNLPYGAWIRLFRAHGFEVLDLLEPRPREDATSSYWDERTHAWARRWPGECIWRLRLRD